MQGLPRIDGPLSPFDAAREQIDEWERTDPSAEHLVLILEAPESIAATLVGDAPIRPSSVAGLCMAAANMALED
ncbi:MAG: hypothetical protein ACYDBH_00565 [Acidobacteriaceae bacterium]